jgi:hypothetical protein
MSIPNYVRPQLTIKQLLDRTPAATINRISTIVVGPQYLLARYGEETLPTTVFAAAGQNLGYSYIDADGATQASTGANVDLASVRVWAEGLEATVAANVNDGANHDVYVPDLSEPNILRIVDHNETYNGATTDFWKGSAVAAVLKDREMQVGDIVYVTEGAVTKKRKVTGFRGKAIAATYGAVTSSDGLPANSAYNPTTGQVAAVAYATATLSLVAGGGTLADFNDKENYVRGPVYNNKFGDKFTLTVITGGLPTASAVRVTSASGLYSLASLTSASGGTGLHEFTHEELGDMLVTIDTTGASNLLVAGAVYSFEIYGDYSWLETDEVDDDNDIFISGTYTGTKDTTILLKVVTTNTGGTNGAGAQFRVSDTAGLLTPTTVTIATDGADVSIGLGLSINIQLGSYGQPYLRVGDVFYTNGYKATVSTTDFDHLILDGPAIDTVLFTDNTNKLDTVKISVPFTGEIVVDAASDDTAWAADATDVTVDASLALYDGSRSGGNEWMAFADAVGTLSVEYRELITAADGEGILTIDSVTDITTLLGTIDRDNDLAYAASLALSGAQGNRIYALRVDSDDAAGFSTALGKTESTDMVYAFAAITANSEVNAVVKAHVLAMSTEEQKKFRRAYIGTDSPGEYVKLSEDEDGDNVQGAFTGTSQLTLTTVSPGVDFTTLGLVEGVDKVYYVAEDAYYVIDNVTSDVLTLETGPPAPTAAVDIQIVKADTPQSQADYIKQISSGLGSRRVAHIWVEGGTTVENGATVSIPNRFVAAEIAGLRSALLPHQGLTRTQITSITDASRMFTRYTPTLLDEVAAAGTFIITQDVESGALYIRHQLTTDSDDGSLYYEDSIGVNLDNISFKLKDLLEGYIGKYNVTPSTIAEIRNRTYTELDEETQTDFGTSYGPALIGFEDLVVEADPALKDRINIYATLLMPLPINNIAVTLRASVDVNL